MTGPVVIEHADTGAWVAAVVDEVVQGLTAALAHDHRPLLLVSGGGTPAPVYRALSMRALPWAGVDIALVDERWLPVGDPASNGRLVQETLLQGPAGVARFEAMILPDRTLAQAVAAANDRSRPATMALLGMGPDGHTASLFPGMRGLEAALASREDHVAVDASGCPGAGPWPWRISATPAGLAKATRRLLLLRGQDKRQLLQRALDGTDVAELPVRALFALPGQALRIHWCP